MRAANVTLAIGRDYPLAPVPRWFSTPWPTYSQVNSGVLLVRPSMGTFEQLRSALAAWTGRESDFADQGFIESFFAGRHITLPAQFNAMTMIAFTTPALWQEILPDMCIVHFTICKPHDDSQCAGYGLQTLCDLWRGYGAAAVR